jgi:DNA-binding response OmpR family regulator
LILTKILWLAGPSKIIYPDSTKLALPYLCRPLPPVILSPTPPPPEITKKIVVVEDDAPMLEMMAMALRSRGYEVIPFTEPREALDWLSHAQWGVDLIVTDIMMPGTSGLTLAKTIRAKAGPVAILLVSAWLTDEALWGDGQEDLPFLAKPFTLPALFEAVEGAMARHPRDTPGSS